jgi:hypothetical protein
VSRTTGIPHCVTFIIDTALVKVLRTMPEYKHEHYILAIFYAWLKLMYVCMHLVCHFGSELRSSMFWDAVPYKSNYPLNATIIEKAYPLYSQSIINCGVHRYSQLFWGLKIWYFQYEHVHLVFSKAKNECTEQNIGMVFLGSHKVCSRACIINGKYNLAKLFLWRFCWKIEIQFKL